MSEGAVELTERAAPVVKTGSKSAAREAYYIARGTAIVAKRLWEAKTNSAYERALRQARTEGNTELYLELESRGERARESRHKRRMDLLTTAPIALVKALALGAATITGLLLMLGVVLGVAQKDAGLILAPISGVIQAITWTYWFLATYGALLLIGGTAIAVAGLWQVGKQGGEPPRWAAPATAEPEGRDQIPDEGAILTALRHLGIQPLNEAFKQGWAPRWISGTCRDGKGWHTQLQMPLGVPVVEVVKRRDKLAHNLMRQPVEVWPTEPKKQPTVLDLWVADQGALSGPVEAWPLLHEGSTDFFQGVPVGVDIRGDVITGRLFEANYAVAGMMGSGKSTLIITLLLGALLDPLVDADVFVFAENADYDPLKPRLRSLTTGAEPENITACAELLKDLFSDLAVRGKALQEHGERKVTRALAEKDHRLRPRIVVIDECQNLFLSEHGDMAEELVVKLITTARKYGIVLIFATPEPSSDSLPRKVVAVISNKACHAIGDQQSNDALLGTGSYKAGISAVDLEPKTSDGPGDIGTAMCRGF
ncbi:MAG: AAA family ATPase, partial [Actinophytocola sp.]|nr:AAA family ATPase [Actinophytocola sp.]